MADDSSRQPGSAFVTMTDVLTLPEDQRQVVRWMMRQGRTGLDGLAAEFAEQAASLPSMLETLVANGFVHVVEEAGTTLYEVRVSSRPARRAQTDIWKGFGN
jgi:hypothetical protein